MSTALESAEFSAVWACTFIDFRHTRYCVLRDSQVWQNEYHASCPIEETAYIKLTLTACGKVVIKFKGK